MNKILQAVLLTTLIAVWGAAPAFAQPHPMGGMPSPHFGGGMTKIFGDNPGFTATLEMSSSIAAQGGKAMPGKMFYLNGKSRTEMDMSQILPPKALTQAQAMHMDKTWVISRPDLGFSYLVYPGLSAYAEMPLADSSTNGDVDFKMETTKLGEETVNGHNCIKNNVIITDKNGKTHESTVWNATDLKKFPVRVETADLKGNFVMNFIDIKLEKPAASLFEPPADFKKYDDIMQLIMSARQPQK